MLKTIETNYGYIDEEQIVMTPFPSDISIIPGIGQIVNNLSIVIPLHNKNDLTNISKKTEFEMTDEVTETTQLGAGNDTDNAKNDTILNVSNAEVIPFNELKRKSMNETVYQSFMHPKMFKTNSATIEKSTKANASVSAKKTTDNLAEEKTQNFKQKHKFNVYK